MTRGARIILFLAAALGAPDARAQSSRIPSEATRPELVLQVGHLGLVCSLAFSADNRWLFSGGGAQGLTVWDVSSGRLVRTLPSHGCPVAFSPDGNTFASGEEKGVLKVWDARAWTELRSLEAPSGFAAAGIDRVRFSADGRMVAALSPGGTFRVWETGTGRFIGGRHDEAAEGLVFGPDGRWLLTFRAYGRISLWELPALRTLAVSQQGQESLALSADMKCTAKPSGTTVLVEGPACAKRELAHGERVSRVALSADGRLAASVSGKGVKTWDLGSGREIHAFSGHEFFVDNVAFSADNRQVASSDLKAIHVWDASSGRVVHSFKLDYPLREGLLAFSPDGSRIIAAAVGGMQAWDLSTGQGTGRSEAGGRAVVGGEARSLDGRWTASGRNVVTLFDKATRGERTLTGYPSDIGAVAATPGGRWLAWTSSRDPVRIEGGDSALRVWDLTTGQLAHRVNVSGPLTVAAAPSGQVFAVGAYEQLYLVNALTGERTRAIAAEKRGEEVNPIAFTPDGSQILTKAAGSTMKLWDAGTGAEIRSIKPPASTVRAISFSPDGKTLALGAASAWTTSEGVFLLDASTGGKLAGMVAHYPSVHSVVFSPDGKLLASGGQDALVKIWDAATRRELFTLKGHGAGVQSLAFSPDGRLLASAGGEAKVWEAATGREVRTLRGHAGAVRSVAFTPDGRWIVTAGFDRAAILWEAATGRQAALLSAIRGGTDWIVVTPDGLFDGTPRALRLLVAWRFGQHETVAPEAFFSEFYYPGLLADIVAGKQPTAPRDFAQLDRRQPIVTLAAESAPEDRRPVTSRTVAVRLEVGEAPADGSRARGSGARDVRLFRNGSLVRVWRGDVLKGQARVRLEANVALVAGENRFTAYAFNNDNIKSPDAELAIRGADSLRRKGTVHVLAIGINHYANRGYDLAYAVADAKAFTEEIARQQRKFGDDARVEVETLFDKAATKANLLAALRRLAEKAAPEDAVFVHFAGHGVADGARFYLIPHDLGYAGSIAAVDDAGFNKILAHSLSDRDLELAFEKIDAGSLLLVIDACHSGQALEAEERRRGPMNSRGLAQLAYEKGMYVLTAAQSHQAALEVAHLGHGLLTYALVLDGLKAGTADHAPKDGRVVMREWLDYATLRVPQMQEQGMLEARKAGRNLAIVAGEEKIEDLEKRSLQRPRVFYRREAEAQPFVVGKP